MVQTPNPITRAIPKFLLALVMQTMMHLRSTKPTEGRGKIQRWRIIASPISRFRQGSTSETYTRTVPWGEGVTYSNHLLIDIRYGYYHVCIPYARRHATACVLMCSVVSQLFSLCVDSSTAITITCLTEPLSQSISLHQPQHPHPRLSYWVSPKTQRRCP